LQKFLRIVAFFFWFGWNLFWVKEFLKLLDVDKALNFKQFGFSLNKNKMLKQTFSDLNVFVKFFLSTKVFALLLSPFFQHLSCLFFCFYFSDTLTLRFFYIDGFGSNNRKMFWAIKFFLISPLRIYWDCLNFNKKVCT
jgi:hypothetical protein